MATAITFNDIFVDYYNLYRGDGSTPTTSDPEWTIALRLANNAIDAWFGDPGMMWNELFTTNLASIDGATTVILNQTAYAAPSNMLRSGGFVKLSNATTGAYFNIQLVDPPQVQNLDPNAPVAYFTGDPNHGLTLNIIPTNLTNTYAGWSIDYVYYKRPTTMTQASDMPEMADTSFMVHHMLANRFRNSRNWPAYQTAMKDAQYQLKNMETIQNSGTWFNSFTLGDSNQSSIGGSLPTNALGS